jgi:2-polyprenyl-3-methyl-5-hydroxy-6-metoxy-1,4-benzoquinol methylase
MSPNEKVKLENISKRSQYSIGVMPSAINYCFKILIQHLQGENILEMGPAEGVMTELLVGLKRNLTVIEGSTIFCESLLERFPKITVVNSLFEEYCPNERYDTIIMGHVLEHVQDPVQVLKNASFWLKPHGRIFAAVPNSNSLHRQAAVLMGLLPGVDSLNNMDLQHGHRRVFSPLTFKKIFLEAELNIDLFGGYWIKPLSNMQIEESWTEDMLNAFMELGERYPEIAGEIYIVASNNS